MSFCVKVFLLFWACFATCTAEVVPKVKCTPEQMRVEIPISATTKRVYLEGLRDYPDPACRPHSDPTGTLVVLELDLRDVYRCAVTRVVNKQTGKQIYYQTVMIESIIPGEGSSAPSQDIRETLHVKCSILSDRNHTISKRDVLLPTGFEEVKELNISDTFTSRAPEPILGVGVRQAGKLITGELNVSPGTPLTMEIFLDKESAPVYGILVTHMQVTDTKSQEETIIYNGCSVDPYLFENFNTVDGDFLTAKFRAFKFPESTYVQFKGTVNVCLGKCKGVECSDGQIGYGRRRRRAIPTLPVDPNKVFEITITSFIKVDDYEDNSLNSGLSGSRKLIVGNQMADDNSLAAKKDFKGSSEELPSRKFKEERVIYTSIRDDGPVSSSTTLRNSVFLLAAISIFVKLFL